MHTEYVKIGLTVAVVRYVRPLGVGLAVDGRCGHSAAFERRLARATHVVAARTREDDDRAERRPRTDARRVAHARQGRALDH